MAAASKRPATRSMGAVVGRKWWKALRKKARTDSVLGQNKPIDWCASNLSKDEKTLHLSNEELSAFLGRAVNLARRSMAPQYRTFSYF